METNGKYNNREPEEPSEAILRHYNIIFLKIDISFKASQSSF